MGQDAGAAVIRAAPGFERDIDGLQPILRHEAVAPALELPLAQLLSAVVLVAQEGHNMAIIIKLAFQQLADRVAGSEINSGGVAFGIETEIQQLDVVHAQNRGVMIRDV